METPKYTYQKKIIKWMLAVVKQKEKLFSEHQLPPTYFNVM